MLGRPLEKEQTFKTIFNHCGQPQKQLVCDRWIEQTITFH
jgi:hypothetical protein